MPESSNKGVFTMEEIADHGLLDEIDILCARGESGRLKITTGITEGALFFKNGQLVDARIGELSGFNAVNAMTSIPDARFSFDSSIAPPLQSSLTPSERILIKDFLGIKTIPPEHSRNPELTSWPNDHSEPQQVVPLTEVEDLESRPQPTIDNDLLLENELSAPLLAVTEAPNVAEPFESHAAEGIATSLNMSDEKQATEIPNDEKIAANDNDEEATLIKPKVPPAEQPTFLPYTLPRNSPYRTGLTVAALVILILVAAAVLLYKLHERSLPPPAIATVQTSSPANGEAVTNTEQIPDLSGNWTVTNTVEQTSYQAFKNLEVGFNLSIDQNGKGFTGKGQKISENGRSLPTSGRTPILVKGSIDGDRVEATFVEDGAVRRTQGRFAWRIEKAGAGLTGTFASSAARASGKSAATKEL
jgi:hypothetical protein